MSALDRRGSLAFNAITRALPADRFVSLTEREFMARAVLAALDADADLPVERPAAPVLDPDRQALVDGLRELADLISARPDLPLDRYREFVHVMDTRAQLNAWADAIDVDVQINPSNHIPKIVASLAGLKVRMQCNPEPADRLARLEAENARLRATLAAERSDPTGLGHSRPVDDEVGAAPVPDGVVDPLHEPDTEHRYEVGDLVHIADRGEQMYKVEPVPHTDGATVSLGLVPVRSTTDPTLTDWVPVERLSLATGRPVSGPPADVPATAPVLTLDHPPRQPAGYDPQPTLIWNGTRVGLAEAYADYARTLDRECPGWWRDDTTRMSAGLAALALERRGAEGGADRG